MIYDINDINVISTSFYKFISRLLKYHHSSIFRIQSILAGHVYDIRASELDSCHDMLEDEEL